MLRWYLGELESYKVLILRSINYLAMVNKLIKNYLVLKGLGEKIKGRREKWLGVVGK